MLSLERSTCVKEALFSPSREVILASKLLAASAAIAAISACQGVGGSAEARTQIRAVGSSTVYPFTTAVAEQFVQKNPKFKPPIVESTGTGGGFKLFCDGVGAQHPDRSEEHTSELQSLMRNSYAV